MKLAVLSVVIAGILAAAPIAANQTDPVADARAILERSVAFPTVPGRGQVPAYAAYLVSVLKQAGFADQDMTITPIGEIVIAPGLQLDRGSGIESLAPLGYEHGGRI